MAGIYGGSGAFGRVQQGDKPSTSIASMVWTATRERSITSSRRAPVPAHEVVFSTPTVTLAHGPPRSGRVTVTRTRPSMVSRWRRIRPATAPPACNNSISVPPFHPNVSM